MPIYLDHNASTPLDEKVFEAMAPFLREHFGNPSSTHRFGRATRAAIDTAREQVAALVGAHPSQVVFTSGGTEANNLALKGVAATHAAGHIAIGAIEHPSVRITAESLARTGWAILTVNVDRQGRIDMDDLQAKMQNSPAVLSIMLANNETGVVQDIPVISELARRAGAVMHTDAVQAAGKIRVDFAKTGVHLMSLSAHKLRGPKGVGALIVDKAVDMMPLIHGGSHEKGRRAGTENVAGIVGFGMAASLAGERLAEYELRVTGLRKRLESGLRSIGGGIEIFSSEATRLPNTVCFGVPGIDGGTLLLNLDKVNIAVSSGSACSSESPEPSPVLQAMGIAPDLARGSLRVSLGWETLDTDIDTFVHVLNAQLAQLRNTVPCVA